MNSLYPEAKMYESMLINKIPVGKEHMLSSICSNGEYFAQLKKDGYFYEFEKTLNYSYLFSRNKSVQTKCLSEKGSNVPHIMEALSCMPPETILIGEIYYPNKTSKAVTEIMGCLAEKAIQRQNGNPIHFYIHDIIYYDGYNLLEVAAITRYKILEAIFYKHNLNQYDFIELAKIETEDIEEKINSALASGEEGMVLKMKDAHYYPGKRPAWVTLKIKQVDYADVIISGIERGPKESSTKEPETWKYWGTYDENGDLFTIEENHYGDAGWFPVTKWTFLGLNTTLILSAYDKTGELINIGRIKSGISDVMIYDMNANPDKYLNKVCAIQCMLLDKDEKTIRHGFFKSLRPDKNIKDCTIDSIF